MKATFATLQTDMMNFDQLCDQYQNESHRFPGLGKKEIARRVNLITELKDLVNGQLTQEYRAVENNQAALAAAQDKARYERGEDGEFDQTRDLDNKQVLGLQKNMLRDQDDQLEEVIGIVKATKYEAQDFNTEIKGQNVRIQKLADDIDQTEENMIDADNKMQTLLQASNHCYLWGIIALEALIMILFFFVF